MFGKLWSRSKEMGWYGVLTMIGGINLADVQTKLAILPDAIETPIVGGIIFIIGVAGAALRAFWRGGVLTGDKNKAANPAQIAAIEEVSEMVMASPADAEALKQAAAQIKLQKEVTAAETLLANVKLAQQKAATTDPK